MKKRVAFDLDETLGIPVDAKPGSCLPQTNSSKSRLLESLAQTSDLQEGASQMNRNPLLKRAMSPFRIGTFALILYLACSSGFPVNLPHASAASREKKWRKDLKALRNNLPGLHANLFFQMTRNEFTGAISELDEAIPSLQDHEIIVGITRIVAMAGDAHTRLDWERSAASFRTYPLRLYQFSDGFYVTATTENYRRALGARLVQVGDTDINLATALISPLIAHDNEWWLRQRVPDYLVVPEILNALHIVPDMEKGRFVFEDGGGERFDFEFSPVLRDAPVEWLHWPDPAKVAVPLYQKNANLFYWFDYLPDSSTLYFKYNVAAEMASLPASRFAEQISAFVATHPVDRFVIDMRDNGGGDSSFLARLLTGLQGRPDLLRRGRLFVIIGRQTFSSAVINAVDIKKQTEAIFVGEPTGGKPNSYGEIRTFVLPKSGLEVRYSIRFFRLMDDDPSSFNPDIQIEMSSADYANGRDPALEAILAYQ